MVREAIYLLLVTEEGKAATIAVGVAAAVATDVALESEPRLERNVDAE